MAQRGTRVGLLLILLAGVLCVFLAINLIGPSVQNQILAAYYSIIGTLLFVFAFRINRNHAMRSSSWWCLAIGIISFAVVFYVDNRQIIIFQSVLSILVLLGSVRGILKSYTSPPESENISFQPSISPRTLPPQIVPQQQQQVNPISSIEPSPSTQPRVHRPVHTHKPSHSQHLLRKRRAR